MPDLAAPPATNPAQTPGAATAATDVSTPGGEPSDPGWFDQLTGRAPLDDEASATGAEQTGDEGEPTASDAKGSDRDDHEGRTPPPPTPRQAPTEPGPDDTVRMTRTQYERGVQAEVDRREAKRAREASKRHQEAELERTAREDPYAFSEQFLAQRAQEQQLGEQTQQVHQLIAATSAQFDAATVTPIVSALPPEVQKRLIAEIQPVGIEGRARLVAASLAEIRRAAADEGARSAEARLRKSPAFRKELLAELRGTQDAPEPLSPGRRSPAPTDMNDWLRAAAEGLRA